MEDTALIWMGQSLPLFLPRSDMAGKWQHFSLPCDDFALAVAADRGRRGKRLLLGIRQRRENRYGLDQFDRGEAVRG